MTKFLRRVAVLLMSAILISCGSSDEETAEPALTSEATEPAPTTLPATTEEPERGENEAATAVPPSPTATTEPKDPTTIPAETSAAANADILFVSATETAAGLWTFSVEVAHPDTGWEDYADGWDVVLPDGTVAKANPDDPFTRLLLHPHENEQPFTRSQSGIPIPPEVTTVTVRAHDLVDGFGGQEVVVDLTAVSGPNFEVNK